MSQAMSLDSKTRYYTTRTQYLYSTCMDKGIQVCGRRKKINCASLQSQTAWTVLAAQDAATQHVGEGKSYEKYWETKAKSK